MCMHVCVRDLGRAFVCVCVCVRQREKGLGQLGLDTQRGVLQSLCLEGHSLGSAFRS